MADTSIVDAVKGTRITFEKVTKAYGPTTVLHGIDLDIAQGEFIALLGPSGCGKTTMLRCLAGLEAVTSGQIIVGGEDVAPVPANKRDMGVVFQAYSLFPHMTVSQNVEFGLQMRKVSSKERKRRVAEALELVGLGALGDRYAHQLSGGQQQRVALARALVTRPRALLLDEPLSALDAKVRVRLRDEIRAIQSELGITTIFVTHDQEEALAVADRVAVMQAGVIEQLGTPEELYLTPATPFVASFIGESNHLEGTITGGTVDLFGNKIDVVSAAGLNDGQKVKAFVRPEHIRIFGADETVDLAKVTGTVTSEGFFGAQRRTVVNVQDSQITVQHSANNKFAVGDEVQLGFSGNPVAVEAL